MFNKKIVSFDLGNTVDCDISQALLDKIKRVREGKEPFSDEIADEIKKIGIPIIKSRIPQIIQNGNIETILIWLITSRGNLPDELANRKEFPVNSPIILNTGLFNVSITSFGSSRVEELSKMTVDSIIIIKTDDEISSLAILANLITSGEPSPKVEKYLRLSDLPVIKYPFFLKLFNPDHIKQALKRARGKALIVADLESDSDKTLSFFESLRREGDKTPIIIVTADNSMDSYRRIDSTCDFFMYKPIGIGDINFLSDLLVSRPQ